MDSPRSPQPEEVDIARHRRRLLSISVVPTLLTLGNLVCGFAAIHYASKPIGPSTVLGWSTLTIAGTLVFIGMLFDALDGFAARLTRSASEFGAQLDSMADMVTFGVAPAYMVLRLVSYYYGGPDHYTGILGPDADNAYGKIMWGIAAFYICCTALRLARFNAETTSTDEADHRFFRGLPSPGAAGAVASLTLLHQHLALVRFHEVPPDGFERTSALALPLITLLVSAAMISRLPYAHIVNRYLRGRQPFAFVAWMMLPLAFAVWWFQVGLAACFTIYALSGPVRRLMHRFQSRGAAAARDERSPTNLR
ncbi:MAG: hypothetical protein EXS01_00855 [Phycisphaerales bacterium]|nr:hypothetical protein [Phycisphaerales bacterium]